MHVHPIKVSRWKHQWGFHNRGVVWDTLVSKCAGEGKDSAQEMMQEGRGEYCPLNDDKTAHQTSAEKNAENTRKIRELDPGGNQGWQQDGGGLDQWQGKAKVGVGIGWECTKATAGNCGPKPTDSEGGRLGDSHHP